MATVQPAKPIYHDPTPAGIRTRRNSSRKSFASSLSRSTSDFESPRAAVIKNGDTFSFDPAHLRFWHVPQDLWDRLPATLQSSLTAVQHSGAAVLTGFARLDKHIQDQDELMQLDELPPPNIRTFRAISNASSVFTSDSSSPGTSASSASDSGCGSPVTASLSHPPTRPTFSPVSLGPPASSVEKRSRSRDRSFSTPLEPHDAKYATELSHLRTEALPRLRHLGRKVDYEWVDAKRSSALSSEDVNAFENWWAEKTCTITNFCNKGKRLADALGLVPTGMGWCAP